uniref:phosphatidylserine decarboxylase n=1 Tax=Branchiostoma floridae TaxID=7739 RepID=C3XVR8_BRAFL|eukprot:XP_002611852.1 hypothetical protein BRAFLDRAFT_83124 [Branchiostoma floridae]
MPGVFGRYVGKTRSLSGKLLGKTGKAGRLIMRTAAVGNELVLRRGLLRLGNFGALRVMRKRRNGIKGRKHFKKVSPADGTVLHFGKVEHNMLEQVKGVTYSLQTFLGRTNNNWWLSKQTLNNSKPPDDENYQQMLLENPEENELYHCTVYLAPGDYHRFHSPAEWEVLHRRHFPGELFSVNPGLVRCIQGLFNYNERVVMSGRWDQGFFSMSAVGATNVGSIRMYMDSELHTNLPGKWKGGLFYDRVFFNETHGTGVAVKKGEIFGEFNLGSSIVIIFEAPRTFSFKVKAGQKIRFGEALGCFVETDQTKGEDNVTETPEAVDNVKHKEE